MVAASPRLNFVSPGHAAAALSRLGLWESSVERPSRTVPYQQLELPPSSLSAFAIHRDQPEQLLRFQGCQPERQFWLDTLPLIEADGRKVTRFQQCGGYAWVHEDAESGQVFLQSETCKLRICPVCRRRIQAKAAARVLDFMQQHPDDNWQFQTFTLKHSRQPLPDQLDRLVKSFRKLRQRKLWRSHVLTGYAVIEIQFHPAGSFSPSGRRRSSDEWHPHLHVVARTDFIPWGPLRKAWLEVTTDSDNIDCEPCESSTHAAHYVAKYIGKPPDLALTGNSKRATEYYRALNARRMLMPFGLTARHHPPTPPPPRSSTRIALFADLLASARNGCFPARCILSHVIAETVPRSILDEDAPPRRQLLLFGPAPPGLQDSSC